MSGTAGSRPPARQEGALGLRLETSFRKAPSGRPRMLQGGEAGPLGREALGRDGRLRAPACGLPLLSSLRGKAENSHVAPLAAAREQVPGQVCTAGGRQSAATSPSPATATGGHATVFTSLSKHGQVMHSPSLLPPTVTTDLLSSCSLPRGPRWLPQHEASHLYTAVSNRKRWGGAEGDVSQKLPGRFLLKRRCAGPDHVPPWHRGLGKQTCGSDDQHGHRPLRRGQVRWPQTKSGFT